MRRALSLILIVGLALSGLPALAQDFGPNTIWGEVPSGVAGNAANAALKDSGARIVATVPVVDGKFAFPNVSPGEYVVVLDGAGQVLATSFPISFAAGATTKAIFDATRVPAAVVASGGGGIGTTALILIGAAAVGIAAAIVIATNDDDDSDQDNASPSR